MIIALAKGFELKQFDFKNKDVLERFGVLSPDRSLS
jgi:hypothetical protein